MIQGVLEQGVDDGPAAGFQTDGDGTAAEALLQGVQPGVEGFGGGGERAFLGDAGGGVQGEGVFFMAPVQPDPGAGGRERGGGRGEVGGGGGGGGGGRGVHDRLPWFWSGAQCV